MLKKRAQNAIADEQILIRGSGDQQYSHDINVLQIVAATVTLDNNELLLSSTIIINKTGSMIYCHFHLHKIFHLKEKNILRPKSGCAKTRPQRVQGDLLGSLKSHPFSIFSFFYLSDIKIF